jgi:adenylyltransferase/sulfurtransferase
VLGPVVSLLASVAVGEAMKLIVGRGKLNPGVIHMDLWSHDYTTFTAARQPDCPACVEHNFEYLDAEVGTASSTLCGRNAVQVVVAGASKLDLAQIERQLAHVASKTQRNDYLLKAQIDGYEFTIFPDNRAIIKGTEDEDLAKTLYARYIGG